MNNFLRAMIIFFGLLTVVMLWSALAPADERRPDKNDANPLTDSFENLLPQHATARFGTTRLRHHQVMTSLAWSPDGKTIVAGGYFGGVRLWDNSGKEFTPAFLPQEGSHVGFFGNSQYLVTVRGSRSSLRVRNLETGKESSLPVPRDNGMDVQVLVSSPDGKLFAVGGTYAGVLMYDTCCSTLLWNHRGHQGDSSMAFSANSKFFAARGARLGSIRICDAATGDEVITLEGHKDSLCALAFAPDSKTLASAGNDKVIRLWDLAKKDEVLQINSRADKLAYSPDGKLLASFGSTEDIVRLWDPTQGEQVRTLHLPGGHPNFPQLAFSPNGKILSVAGAAHSLYFFDVATGKEVMPRPGHQHAVLSVAFSPDGKTLASRSGDNTVRLWDVATGQERRQFSIGDGSFFVKRTSQWTTSEHTVAFSPDGKYLAAVGGLRKGKRDTFVYLWEADSGQQVAEFLDEQAYPFTVAFSPDSQLLTVPGSTVGSLWSMQAKEKVGFLPPRRSWCAAFSPDDLTLAGWDPHKENTVTIWDRQTNLPLRSFKSKLQHVTDFLEFSPSGHFLAIGEGNPGGSTCNHIELWEPATGERIHLFDKTGGSVPSVAFSPDGRLLAVATLENWSVQLWDVFNGKQLAKFEGHSGPVRSVAFSPDGKTVASGSDDTTVLLWDVSNFYKEIVVGKDPVAFPKYDPDGFLIAPTPNNLEPKHLTRLWNWLKGWDKDVSPYKAVWVLSAGGDTTVSFLSEQVKPVSEPDPKQVRQLITDLNSDTFAIRQGAAEELTKLGLLVEPALRDAFKNSPPKQVEVTLKRLLEKISVAPLADEEVRQSRALLVLELIGTPAARDLLRKLAEGASGARLTRDARLALQRLERLDKFR